MTIHVFNLVKYINAGRKLGWCESFIASSVKAWALRASGRTRNELLAIGYTIEIEDGWCDEIVVDDNSQLAYVIEMMSASNSFNPSIQKH